MLTEPKFFDEFCDAFAHSGSILIKCDCGITHVADDELGYLEEEEILELQELEASDPDSIIRWGCSSISWTTVNGRDVVFGCPCGCAEELCYFIENHHTEIMQVIKKIVEFERRGLEKKEELLQKTTGVE